METRVWDRGGEGDFSGVRVFRTGRPEYSRSHTGDVRSLLLRRSTPSVLGTPVGTESGVFRTHICVFSCVATPTPGRSESWVSPFTVYSRQTVE